MQLKDIQTYQSGIWLNQKEYKSFSPSNICHAWIISEPELTQLLSEANRCIGALDAYSQLIPDIDFFIKMHIAKEATTSNKIEGTQTSMEEAFLKEEDINPEKRDDWHEVNNYVKAINFAIDKLNDLPLSSRLVRDTHRIILDAARGKEKLPGEFRKSQNWIGASLKNATFVPPIHTEINALMNDLEKYMNAEILELDIHVPHLIKIAMIHYQFETIHPFLDRNGRLGRLLITLILCEQKMLREPMLYLSLYFKSHRQYYYELLNGVRLSGNWEAWLDFFAEAVIVTATQAVDTARQLIDLADEDRDRISGLGRAAASALRVHRALMDRPITASGWLVEKTGITPATVNKCLVHLERLGIVRELTSRKRNRVFSYAGYLEIINQGTELPD